MKPTLDIVIGACSGIGLELSKLLKERVSNSHRRLMICKTNPNADLKLCISEFSISKIDTNLLENIFEINMFFCHRYRGNSTLSEFDLQIMQPIRIIEEFMSNELPLKNCVFLSSTCTEQPVINQTAGYHAVRGAINALIKKLSLDYGPAGMRVNGVALNTIIKDSNINFFEKNQHLPQQIVQHTPLRSMGTARQIASVAYALTTKSFDYVTGNIVTADGGLSIVNQENIFNCQL